MLDLFTLAPRVARLERRVRAQDAVIAELARRAGLDVADVDPMRPDDAERDLVARGRRIEAIKHHRERTGSGLAEAKAVIDILP